MRRVGYPFLTLTDNAVTAEPWSCCRDDSSWQPLADHLRDWDAASKIAVRRVVKIDWNTVAKELEIPQAQVKLQLCTKLGSGLGRVPRTIVGRFSQNLDGQPAEIMESLEINGHSIASLIRIETVLSLATKPSEHSELSPSEPGAKIWATEHIVSVDGEQAQFPMEMVDLENYFRGEVASNAGWYLHRFTDDWDRDLQSAVRLYLNSKSEQMLQELKEGNEALLSHIQHDVVMQLCSTFLSDPLMSGETEYSAEPGSLGAQVLDWFNIIWPGKSIAQIKNIASLRPGTFHANILALVKQELNQ
jgi:hypothetical protein